jgi:Tfp pilus assembly protein PilX
MIRLFRRGIRHGDEGAAMLMVLGVLFVTTLFLLSSLAYALRSMAPTRRDEDAKIALAAAQAGVDEYVSRLTANDNYWEQGSSDTSNAAFSSSGQTIQGTGGAGAKYSYQLLTTASDTAQTGQIKLKVTGTSTAGSGHDSVSRTMTATLRPKIPQLRLPRRRRGGGPGHHRRQQPCANYPPGAATLRLQQHPVDQR